MLHKSMCAHVCVLGGGCLKTFPSSAPPKYLVSLPGGTNVTCYLFLVYSLRDIYYIIYIIYIKKVKVNIYFLYIKTVIVYYTLCTIPCLDFRQ